MNHRLLAKAVQRFIPKELRNVTTWSRVKTLAESTPGLLQHPIDSSELPGFARWRYTKIYSSPQGHTGLDYHVYEDAKGGLHFVPPFTKIRPILPGVVIYHTEPEIGPGKVVCRNSVTMLHSLPENGEWALISSYSHVGSDEGSIWGSGTPSMALGLFCRNAPDKKEMWLQHLHLALGYCRADKLSELIRTGKQKDFPWGFEGNLFVLLYHKSPLWSKPPHDPWEIFPPEKPERYAWFDDSGNLFASDQPQRSVVSDFDGRKMEF